MDTITIPVTVNPGNPYKVAIDPLVTFAQPNDIVQTIVRVYDIWDNPIITDTELEVGGFGAILVNGQTTDTINVTSGAKQITVGTTQP